MHPSSFSSAPIGIAAFRSRSEVLRLESLLRREGLPCGVLSTPRQVAMGCGLSVRFDPAHLPRVRAVLADLRPIGLIGLYLVSGYGTRDAKLTPVSRS